ncbi:MAG TPA: hypothetical protein VK541_11290 [Pedobacter sp.]|uniref:hypothetical protein n=1 Tax=Pedobacter sp. TaxID=1411316 RepID=UPI002C1BE26F|nr:hypothetical protein [Pedobacter sp.]HMI03059.1 hypothetical protein [Pedobacter sp.]
MKTRDEAEGLYNLIVYLLKANPYSNRMEKILDLAMFRISEQIRKKLISRHPRDYHITLDEEDSLKFEEWLAQNEGSIPFNTYVYELNTATQISTQINKQYG